MVRVENVSLPARGAWIEMTGDGWNVVCAASLPARGAWIEIICAL